MSYKDNLKEYIVTDNIYNEWLNNKNCHTNDFEEFCIEHCRDINEALDYIEKLEDKIVKLVKDINEKEDYIEKLENSIKLLIKEKPWK